MARAHASNTQYGGSNHPSKASQAATPKVRTTVPAPAAAQDKPRRCLSGAPSSRNAALVE